MLGSDETNEFLDSEAIITEVGKWPCLYDSNSPDFKDRFHREEAWKSVFFAVVGDQWDVMTADTQRSLGRDIQKRWKNMRDAYKRSIVHARKMKKRRGENFNKNRRPYVYHKQMAFMRDSLESPMSPADLTDGRLYDVEEPQEDDKSLVHISNQATITPAPTSLKQKLPEQFENNIVENWVGTYQSLEKDHDEMFLQSLLPHVKKLSSANKLDFQIKTLQLLQTYICEPPTNQGSVSCNT